MKNFNENLEILSERELEAINGGYISHPRFFLFRLAVDSFNAGRDFVRWANS